jgi:subtilase family serine protease
MESQLWRKYLLSTSLMAAAVLLMQTRLSAQTVSVLAGNHPRQAESMAPSGDVEPQQRLSMAVTMSLHNRAELNGLLADQQDPTSPDYHRWLTPEQFAARFGPSVSEVEEVENWLVAQGFKVTRSSPEQRVIKFIGTVGQAKQAFNVSLKTFAGAYANVNDPEIPARFAGVISYIHGLDNMHATTPTLRPAPFEQWRPAPDGTAVNSASSPQELQQLAELLPDSVASSDATDTEPITGPDDWLPQVIVNHQGPSFGPADLQAFYNEKPLLGARINGASAGCIGIVGDSDYMAGALASFNRRFHLPAASITTVQADSSDPGFNSDESEALIDLEWSHAVAPNAPITFYVGVALEDAIGAAVSDPARCGVISISFGYCGEPVSFYQNTLDPMFAQAASQGQSVMVAAGDDGAAGLVYSPAAGGCVVGDSRGVSELAADPNVTAVGGTSFAPTYNSKGMDVGQVSEGVWNDPEDGKSTGGATGGGASAIFPKPAYQTGEGVPADGTRDVPDVSMVASPYFPGVFTAMDNSCFTGSHSCKGEGPVAYYQFGGTSLATPLWAGITRLIAQAAQQPYLGNLNPTIYSLANAGLAESGFRDIVRANNDFNFVTGYNAGPGYDQCTGWGTVDIANFVKAYDSTLPGPPALTVKLAQLTFKPVAVGKSKRKYVSIVNPSTSTQRVWATIQTVSAGGDFSTAQNCVGAWLAPGKRCKFAVTFAPTAPGPAAEVTLEISDTAGNSPQTVTLDGTGSSP